MSKHEDLSAAMADFSALLAARANAPPEWDLILSAAQKNKADEVARLIDEKGVSPSHGNVVGQTALHIAGLWGSVETMEVLINAGANVDAQNQIAKMTPLHCAIRGTFQSFRETHERRLKCVELLLKAGADGKLRDTKGKDAYDSIDDAINEAKARKMGSVEKEMEEMRAVLQRGGLDMSTLQTCFEKMDVAGMREYLSGDAAGAVEKNRSLLDVAEKFKSFVDEGRTEENAYKSSRDMIKCLLDAGADPNSHPKFSDSPNPMEGAPLHIVASSICATTSATDTIWDVAAEIVGELRSNGAKVGTVTMALLPNAAHRNKVKAVKFLLDSVGVDPNYRGRQGMTGLILASRTGKIDIVRLLLEQDTLDVSVEDDAGKKAIDYATANGKEEIVSLLLERN